MSKKLFPPFPYFGGKRNIADTILKGIGTVQNYVEPFAGSLAILLANRNVPKIETVNDINCMISNFWRSIANDPKTVAKYADNPVNESDMHAKHIWLGNQITDSFVKNINDNIDFFDAKMAGYWVWGMGCSIADNWLNEKGLNAMPLVSSAGGGVHGLSNNIYDWFDALHNRLRKVRVLCGSWERAVGKSITYGNRGLSSKDITAIVLDPPYPLNNRAKVYKNDNDIFSKVKQFAIENGNNPKLRIVLCGYSTEDMPNDWRVIDWKSNGGFSSIGDDNSRGKSNRFLERLWFSPHCLEV